MPKRQSARRSVSPVGTMSSTASLLTAAGESSARRYAHAPAAVVAGDEEFFEAELLHDLDLVARHRALRIGLVIGAGLGLAAAAVAAQVRANNRVVLGEPRRDLRPHGVGLGETVQQQQRRTGAALAQADGDFVGLYVFELKSIEHGTLD